MICLNLNIPQINKDYQELSKIFNPKIAYALLAKNNGYGLEYNPNGEQSELYNKLLVQPQINGDRIKVLKLKARTYTDSFLNWHGNWIEKGIEPSLFEGKYFNGNEYKSLFNESGTELSSLQGKALNFLKEEGKRNISKIFDEDSITIDKDSKFKDKARVLNMLEDSSEDFKKNGLFIHNGDEYITHLNANLFENLLDTKRLITRMNDKMQERLKSEGLSTHNIITANKHEGKYWLTMTDGSYGKTWDDATAPERRNKILERNRYWIDEANKVFALTTGKPVISLKNVQVGKYTTAIVSFDEKAMKEYNSIKYTEYLNNMNEYMSKNKDQNTYEDFTIAPLKNKLQQELRYTRKAKSNLESQGAKKIDINRLDNKIEDLSTRITKLQKSEDLTDIYNEAEKDFININKLLNSDKLSTYQFNQSLNKLQLWITSGDFSTSDHLFLDEEMMESQELQDKFASIGKRAELLMAKLMDKGKPMLANIVNEEFGTELTYDKVVELGHKLGWFPKLGYSLNRVGHALAQFILKTVNEANDAAYREVKIESRELEDLYKNVKSSGFDIRNFYQQVSETIKGKNRIAPTGRLIHKFSDQYFKDKAKNKTVKFRNTYEFTIDPRELTGPNKEAYVKEIESHLGKLEADKYIKLAQERYNNYLNIRNEHLSLEYGVKEGDISELSQEQLTELEDWDKQNSPIARIEALKRTKERDLKNVYGKDTYLVIIPKKEIKGKLTGYIDSNFSKIENNKAAYDFYQKAESITRSAQVAYGYSELTSLSLAYVKMGIMDRLSKTGIANFLSKDMYNEVVKSMSGGKIAGEEIDPITKKPIKKIKPDIETVDQLIKARYKTKLKELQDKEQRDLTDEEQKELYFNASDEVMSTTNFDANNNSLYTSLNLLNLAALTYKHSSLIEDNINMAMTYLPNSTVNTGNKIVDNKGNSVGQEYINNLQDMVENTLDKLYYKTTKKDTSTVLRHLYTKEQKDKVKALRQELLKPSTSNEEKVKIKDQIAQIQEGTKKLTTNSLVRTLMSFVRLKGLGWNIPAAINNLIYGQLTNLYQAADGRFYSIKEFGQACTYILTDWKKFNKIIENYHIVGDVLYEYKSGDEFKDSKNWFFKTIKSLKPYSMQTATEKLNQGAVMIAMMLNQKVTNSKGETKSLWESIDSNGKLSNDWSIGDKSGENAIISMISKIKSQIDRTHGDYRNPLMIKNTMAGQTAGMFRLWFFEMFHSRFGAEKMDYIGGILTKGRYRTILDLAKDYGFNPIAWRQAYKNNSLSEVDKANMKVNFMEFATIVLVLAAYGFMKKGICGDNERCKDANLFQNLVLNNMKKLNQDVAFYINPKSWSDFIGNPTSMTSILSDSYKLLQTVGTELFGDEDDTIYKTGYNKGNKKLWVLFKNQVPFVNSIERLNKYSEELIQSK